MWQCTVWTDSDNDSVVVKDIRGVEMASKNSSLSGPSTTSVFPTLLLSSDVSLIGVYPAPLLVTTDLMSFYVCQIDKKFNRII